MDITTTRSLSEQLVAHFLDRNRDGRLSADELSKAMILYIATLPTRAASFEPPSPEEFKAFETATPASIKLDVARFAKDNARLFPNGIEPLNDEQCKVLSDAARQTAALIRQMPDPDLATKVGASEQLFEWGSGAAITFGLGEIIAPKSPPDAERTPLPAKSSRPR